MQYDPGFTRCLLQFSSLMLPATFEKTYGVNDVFWQEKNSIFQVPARPLRNGQAVQLSIPKGGYLTLSG